MRVYLFFVLVIAVLVAVFAVENTSPVDLKFLFWSLPQVSVVLVIICSFVVGALAAFFLSLTKMIRQAIKYREVETLNRRLAEEIDLLKSEQNKKSSSSGEV